MSHLRAHTFLVHVIHVLVTFFSVDFFLIFLKIILIHFREIQRKNEEAEARRRAEQLFLEQQKIEDERRRERAEIQRLVCRRINEKEKEKERMRMS